MIMLSLFSTLLLIANSLALMPNNLPSGKGKIYKVNKYAPASDLVLLPPNRIRFIAKHWENNILHTSKEIRYEDEHIIYRIDELYDIIDNNHPNDKRFMYLSWSPIGAIREILFIVVAEINVECKTFVIRLVLQSPFWESRQIESKYLKYALEDLLHGNDKIALDLSELYSNDRRISLEWLTLDMES